MPAINQLRRAPPEDQARSTGFRISKLPATCVSSRAHIVSCGVVTYKYHRIFISDLLVTPSPYLLVSVIPTEQVRLCLSRRCQRSLMVLVLGCATHPLERVPVVKPSPSSATTIFNVPIHHCYGRQRCLSIDPGGNSGGNPVRYSI